MTNSFVQRTIHPLDSEFEPDIERHTRFTETQAGALVCHDYERRQYCRIYQSEVDLDIIRRFVDRNFCSHYPDVTVRYFAQNWPELCIIAFTDTHIPIGLIIGQQAEPHVGRIAFLAVEKRVGAELIYKRLLQLELEKMHAIGIRQVLLKPLDEQTRRKLLRYMGNAPMRYVNQNGEFQFHI
ncbi:N-acetyltransferase mak3 [Paragonimus skrjabini miyazakii]|uniref:N-acetyltransferase mak3 n=1 Tax=Paragonimus skrjabini miyazakii TaxID=59628 RepID=A0A8S9YDP6_9TREM|nr:N-acetyltransferase mak3 [Paragonimus skrjabini miyazakii]